jgi:hypothetical protein
MFGDWRGSSMIDLALTQAKFSIRSGLRSEGQDLSRGLLGRCAADERSGAKMEAFLAGCNAKVSHRLECLGRN